MEGTLGPEERQARRYGEVYQTCRDTEDVEAAYDVLMSFVDFLSQFDHETQRRLTQHYKDGKAQQSKNATAIEEN